MLSESLARKAAANHRHLRRLGITVHSIVDMIVGTYCIEGGYALLHDDADFRPMVKHLGLREYRPSA
jgi:predicted nucleic acid-binding protein